MELRTRNESFHVLRATPRFHTELRKFPGYCVRQFSHYPTIRLDYADGSRVSQPLKRCGSLWHETRSSVFLRATFFVGSSRTPDKEHQRRRRPRSSDFFSAYVGTIRRRRRRRKGRRRGVRVDDSPPPFFLVSACSSRRASRRSLLPCTSNVRARRPDGV